jgi:Cytochrome C oxidase, cbb3-type, subunit III
MANWAVKWLVIANLVGLGTFAWAQDADMGESTYQAICAPCHGTDGKGNGPLREALKVAAPDLTILAKKNGGVLSVSALYDVIDGRKAIAAHGTRKMPVWGAFSPELLYPYDKFLDSSYDPEVTVRTHILAIIDYLSRIQEK